MLFTPMAFAEKTWVKPDAQLDEVIPPVPVDLNKAALRAEVLALDSFTFMDIRKIVAKHGALGTNAQARYVIGRLVDANKFMTYKDRYLELYPPAEEPTP